MPCYSKFSLQINISIITCTHLPSPESSLHFNKLPRQCVCPVTIESTGSSPGQQGSENLGKGWLSELEQKSRS